MLGLQEANIPGQLMVTLFSKNSNLCDHNPPTSKTDRRTDRQTTCDRNTALCTKVHRAVKMASIPAELDCIECSFTLPLKLSLCIRQCTLCALSEILVQTL